MTPTETLNPESALLLATYDHITSLIESGDLDAAVEVIEGRDEDHAHSMIFALALHHQETDGSV